MPSGLTYVVRGVIWSHFLSHDQVYLDLCGRCHNFLTSSGSALDVSLLIFYPAFPPSFLLGVFSMVLHAVYFLHYSVKLDGLTTLDFSTGAGLFVGPLHGVIAGVLLQYFTILRGVSGDMQQAFFSPFIR